MQATFVSQVTRRRLDGLRNDAPTSRDARRGVGVKMPYTAYNVKRKMVRAARKRDRTTTYGGTP